MLGEGPTDDINGSIGKVENTFSINSTNAKTKFCVSLDHNGDNTYLFVNEKKIYKFKASNKYVDFQIQFCLGNISKEFDVTESGEISLKGNLYDFSINCNA